MKALVIGLVFLSLGMGFEMSANARTLKRLSDPQMEETIQAALSQHRTDSASFWQDLGPRAPIVLVRMYTETRHTYLKARLIAALGYYDTPDVAAFLRETAQSAMSASLRRAAIRALGRSQGMKEEAFFTRALRSTNPHTRLAAAEALKNTGDRKALTLVDTYVKQEKATWVVAKLKKN